jgi:hypothetical protein
MWVPAFIVMISLTRLLAGGVESLGLASPRPPLLLQFLLIAGLWCIVRRCGFARRPERGTRSWPGCLDFSHGHAPRTGAELA